MDTKLAGQRSMFRPYGTTAPNPPTTVSELIISTTASWNRPLIQQIFMPIDAQVVLAIPLCTRNISDFWAWYYEKHGAFTVKSAYKMLIATKLRREAWLEVSAGPSNSIAEEGAWKKLWQTQVPGKVRMFLWRLSKHSIPTNDVRAHRHMSGSSACGICGAQDSWRHSLIECSMSRCVWALSDEDILEHMLSNRTDDARLWIFWLFETTNQHDLAKILVMMWAIWWARRKAIHDNEYQSPLSLAEEPQERQRQFAETDSDLGASAIVFDGLVDAPSLEAHAYATKLLSWQGISIFHMPL